MAPGSPPSPHLPPSASPSSSSPSPPDAPRPPAAVLSTPSPSPAAVIVFFDVETTIPSRAGQGFALLEFGAILVCPRRLVELGSYSTLVRPRDLSAISPASVRCNGITRESVAAAPGFEQVADRVYDILHGNVWAGHNILRFDCLRIREAFEEIGRPAPEPVGTIDSLPLLTQRFGRRAGDMKMATLASYFGLGRQTHRSLDDVRMNIEVLKCCATVLFLESSLLECSAMTSFVSPNAIIKNHGGTISPGEMNPGASDLTPLIEHMRLDTSPTDISSNGRHTLDVPQCFSEDNTCQESDHYHGFLDPDKVSTYSISAPVVPSNRGGNRIMVLHGNTPLQLYSMGLKVRFGVNEKFSDYAGRPKLSIVVDAPASLCNLLKVCDNLAGRSNLESGSSSEWRPVIRSSFSDSYNIRLHIPTIANGDVVTYSTEIYQKESSGAIQKLVFSRADVAELEPLFVPGTVLDAYFCIDVYSYQQYAGMRLVAKRFVIHPRT